MHVLLMSMNAREREGNQWPKVVVDLFAGDAGGIGIKYNDLRGRGASQCPLHFVVIELTSLV